MPADYVDYVGPSSLMHMIEREYKKICDDYDRKNAKVIIGVPFIEELGEVLGFSSQRELNRFVDGQVRKIISTFRNLEKGRLKAQLDERYYREIRKLRKVSFIHGEFPEEYSKHVQGAALYQPILDAVFLDVCSAVTYFLTNTVLDPINWDIPSNLKHELVHYDVGECLHSVEARALYQKDDEASLVRLAEREKRLRIDVLNEAIAMNYIDERSLFKCWLRQKGFSRGDRRRAMQMYGHLAKLIESQGKLPTLRQVKQAINQSYSEDKDALDVVLSGS